jgi:hypothetical protein
MATLLTSCAIGNVVTNRVYSLTKENINLFVPKRHPMNDSWLISRRSQYLYCIASYAEHSSRAVCDMNCLRSLERWDHGFESHSRHGCLYCVRLFCVYVLRVGRGLAMG